jgi:hypothetical protein
MASASTYVPIASYTVTGSTLASYTFSSIPSTYTDLVLVLQGGDTPVANNQYFRLNGDSGTNYTCLIVQGNGGAYSPATNTNYINNFAQGRFAWYASPDSYVNNWIGRVHFMNYSNTTTYKTILGRTDVAGVTYPGTEASVNMWRSTAAINSITLFYGSTDAWSIGSTFALYGIQAA